MAKKIITWKLFSSLYQQYSLETDNQVYMPFPVIAPTCMKGQLCQSSTWKKNFLSLLRTWTFMEAKFGINNSHNLMTSAG